MKTEHNLMKSYPGKINTDFCLFIGAIDTMTQLLGTYELETL